MMNQSMRKYGPIFVLLCVFLLSSLTSGVRADGSRAMPSYTNAYDPIISSTARDFGVEPALVKAVIAAESSFWPEAVSPAGALGLMQLMPETAAELGVADPFDPTQNIEGGTRYLSEMLDRSGDIRRALAAYNAGPHAVDRYDGVPPYRETRLYISRVLRIYRSYRDDLPPAMRASSAGRRRAVHEPTRATMTGIEMIRGTVRTR